MKTFFEKKTVRAVDLCRPKKDFPNKEFSNEDISVMSFRISSCLFQVSHIVIVFTKSNMSR